MKCLQIVSVLFLLCGGVLSAYPSCSDQLSSHVKKLYSLNETRELLNAVEAQGALTIQAASLGKNAANAAWFYHKRTICINMSNPRPYGGVIRSIIFELHNALSQKDFDRLDELAAKKMISRNNYIEAVERLEYANALKTIALLKKGVAQNIFPTDTQHWPIAESFEKHYAIQYEAGHAQHIGTLYDSLAGSSFRAS